MKTIKPDNQQQLLVDFLPAPTLTNNMIATLNAMTTQFSPQEFASYIASYVAAFGYVMHSNNSTEQIVKLFTMLVEDAGKQYEHRKALIAKEQSAIIRLDHNG